MGVLGNVSDFLVVTVALLFTCIAFVDFFGDCFLMGRSGAKFYHELNIVVGGLLGIPRYSKVEGVIFTLLALGCFNVFTTSGQKQLWIIVGIMGGVAYMIMVIMFRIIAKQKNRQYITFAVLLAALDVWRMYAFLEKDDYLLTAGIFFAMCTVAALAVWRMKSRAEEQKETLERYAAIQKYCDENPDHIWYIGEECPVGFVLSQTA